MTSPMTPAAIISSFQGEAIGIAYAPDSSLDAVVYSLKGQAIDLIRKVGGVRDWNERTLDYDLCKAKVEDWITRNTPFLTDLYGASLNDAIPLCRKTI
ncbi:MAG: hypothetical protein KBC64_06575 [Simkaniaceae bacterium]|nr:hypothetical protein [Simkaniaceae bacterium]